MHDRTRRMLCRAGFLALCVLPTLGVFAWSNSRTTAGHSATCSAELSRELGLRVSLVGVSYPRPGITLYDGIELADPETSAPLVQMRSLEVGGGEKLTALVAHQPEVEAVQLGRLWDIIANRLRQPAGSQPTVCLAAGEATLRSSERSQTLTAVDGQSDSKPGSGGERVAALSFRLAGVDSPGPIRLHCSRRLEQSRPICRIDLDTGGAEVPCWLLTAPLGISNRLGKRARFRGSVWATESADGWEGELSGEFRDVDLQSVVTEQFPHQLNGTAEITILKARFRRGRLEEASGRLTAGPGVVSQSLLTAAAANFHLRSHAGADLTATLIPYDQLAFVFTIDSSGLTLQGRCDGPSGTILRGGGTALLAESGGATAPVVAVLRTLVPQSEVQVPATRETDWLMQRLPVPQVMPPPNVPPQGRLRLAPQQGPG